MDPARLPRFSAPVESLSALEPEADFTRALDFLLAGLIAADRS